MATQHEVALYLGTTGTRIDVFDRYDIVHDMLSPGSPWTFSLWRSATREAAWQVLRREVKLFDRVFLSIDGAVQLNGRIEVVETRGSREGAVMILSGRDLSGPAMDWDADPRITLKDLPLSDALARLFQPLGIATRIGVSAADIRRAQQGLAALRPSRSASSGRGVTTTALPQVVDRAHPRPGEKVWQLAEAIAKRLGFLLWTAPDAAHALAVVVAAPAYDAPVQYRLERRIDADTGAATGNILEGIETLSIRGVPTEVNVYTGTPRGDTAGARSLATTMNAGISAPSALRGFVLDEVPDQPRHIRAERARTLAAAYQHGSRVVSDAMARARTYQCTVQGHGTVFGGETTLYAIDAMAHVRDDLCTDPDGAPLDEDMLITRVAFSGSRGGSEGRRTQLTLSPRGAIVLEPEAA